MVEERTFFMSLFIPLWLKESNLPSTNRLVSQQTIEIHENFPPKEKDKKHIVLSDDRRRPKNTTEKRKIKKISLRNDPLLIKCKLTYIKRGHSSHLRLVGLSPLGTN